MNHKDPNDVTDGYIIFDVERLRVPMQKITDFFLGHFSKQILNHEVISITAQGEANAADRH